MTRNMFLLNASLKSAKNYPDPYFYELTLPFQVVSYIDENHVFWH